MYCILQHQTIYVNLCYAVTVRKSKIEHETEHLRMTYSTTSGHGEPHAVDRPRTYRDRDCDRELSSTWRIRSQQSDITKCRNI